MTFADAHLGALVVFTQQRVRQRAQRGEQHPVGDAQTQNHVDVGGERGQAGAQTKRQVGKEIKSAKGETLLQFL